MSEIGKKGEKHQSKELGKDVGGSKGAGQIKIGEVEVPVTSKGKSGKNSFSEFDDVDDLMGSKEILWNLGTEKEKLRGEEQR